MLLDIIRLQKDPQSYLFGDIELLVEGGDELLARLPVTALEPDNSKQMQNFLPAFGSTYDWRVFIEVMSVLLDHFCSHFPLL